MSKALIVASVASMIDQFNRQNIQLLKELGFDVYVACNFIEGNTCSPEKIQQLKTDLQSEGVTFSQVDFARSPYSPSNVEAYKELKKIFAENHFDLVHCHAPMGGVLGRLVAKKYRKTGTKVFYTAHGFHFFKGAPLINWLLYYPVEWLFAYWTDVLITINKEDFARAQKHMHAKQVVYVPGVGIDLQRFAQNQLSQEEKDCLRRSISVGKEDKLLLSVGELIRRKNHESVIRALAMLDDSKLKYRICGRGELESYLQDLIDELHLTDRVQLLGYRNDISELCECADLFVFPSFQEGLPVALMEAIASKVPVICSDIRGNSDLVGAQELFNSTDIGGIAKKIRESLQKDHTEEIERNYRNLKKYDLAAVISDMAALYYHGGKTPL